MEDICCRRAISSRLARCSSCIEFPLIASVCSIALGYTYKRWGGKRLPILRSRQFPRPPNMCYYKWLLPLQCSGRSLREFCVYHVNFHSPTSFDICLWATHTMSKKEIFRSTQLSLCSSMFQDTLKHHIKMLFFFLAFTVARSFLSLWIPALFSFHCPCTD